MHRARDGADMLPAISTKRQRDVWKKTEGHCAYCGVVLKPASDPSRDRFCIDHIHPRFLGGASDVGNLAPVCHRCNCGKRARSLEDYRRVLFARRYAVFTEAHIAHLTSLGVVLPPEFPCYPPLLFWFEKEGIAL
jgi:Restriction endonuclease